MTSIKPLSWLTVSVLMQCMQCIFTGEPCNNGTEFTCSSGSCIPLDKVNNTVNDCGDNSDEGLGYCGHIISFKCTNGENCIPMEWVLDNAADCSDRSDETKLIGSECTDETELRFPCDEYISKGSCINDTCSCQPGLFPNDLGTACTENFCPEGQRWNDCASPCIKTCDNPRPLCISFCVPHCECPSNAPIWHEDTCIKEDQCTHDTYSSLGDNGPETTVKSETCPVGQTWHECGSACIKTCENPTPLCVDVCVPCCQCPYDTPIWHQEKCIKLEQCTNGNNQTSRTTARKVPSAEPGTTRTGLQSTQKMNPDTGPTTWPTSTVPSSDVVSWLPISSESGTVIGLAVAVGFLCAGLLVSLILLIFTCHRGQQGASEPHEETLPQHHDKPKPQLEQIAVTEKPSDVTQGYLTLGLVNHGISKYSSLDFTDRRSHDSEYYQIIQPENSVYEEIKDQREINLIIR